MLSAVKRADAKVKVKVKVANVTLMERTAVAVQGEKENKQPLKATNK